ncbi:IS3 family transposase, partial [Paraburkholderia sp. SIMBA_054]|uniref:IS3 family transposase n=1 Tax=Paraburkholderia sp. SIMBA_054 TaxID=3085795 RepID=UPI00397E1B80
GGGTDELPENVGFQRHLRAQLSADSNSPTESLWGSLKRARILGQRFATRRDAMDEVIDWLSFYNHSRLHSTLGYVSPMQFEQDWYAAQNQRVA